MDTAVANTTGSPGEVKICPGTYGNDEDIHITSNIEIKTIGTGTVTVQSTSGDPDDPSGSDQESAILIDETSAEEITFVEIRGLTIEHSRDGGDNNATTILMRNGVAGVELKNLKITRSGLANTASAIRPDSTNITVQNNDISGGPIGFFGDDSGDYTITGNTIRGAGDEGIWVVDANTLTITGNTIETTSDGDSRDDQIAAAVYYVDTHLVLENNTFNAEVAPLLLGNDVPIKTAGGSTVSLLQTASDMWTVLDRNSINGSSPGKVTFVAQSDGTLRGMKGSASGNVDTVHVVRTGLTDSTNAGGSGAYDVSALYEAQDGDVIHLSDGAVYDDRVTMTPVTPTTFGDSVDVDLGFSSRGAATLDTLGMEGAYTVNAPSGTLVIGDSLFAGQGSSLVGNPVELSPGSVLEDKGLVSGTLAATRTVGGTETVDFGNIGLTLTEDGGSNTPGQTTVTRTDGDPVTMGKGSIERYYDVAPTNTSGLKVDLTFDYDDGTVGDNELDANGLTESNLALFRSEDGGSTWSEQPPVSNFEPSNNILRAQDLSSFSRFTAAESGSALPVELADFSARLEGEAVELRWATASEQGNAGFDIQRAIKENGSVGSFQKIGFVDGVGTSSSRSQYHFEDTNLPYEAETLVYRLRQVDQDGSVTLSDPVTIEKSAPSRSSLSGSVSNPVRKTATIRYELAQNARVEISVFNTLGQRVATLVDSRKEAGRQSIDLDVSTLPSGMYFIRMQTDAVTQTERMTIVR